MSTGPVRKVGVLPLIDASTATATSAAVEPWHTNRTFEAYGATSSSTGAATIIIEVRNSEDSSWHTMATISLTLGVTVTGDGFSSSAAWRYVRARLSAISGTGAAVSVNLGSAPL